MTDPERPLLLREAADLLGLHVKTLRRIAREDPTFPLLRYTPRGTGRVQREALQRWLERRQNLTDR